MIDALHSEWLKVRTIRQHWVIAFVAVAFPIVVSVLTALFADTDDTSSRDLLELVAGLAIVSAMLVGVLGVLNITSEFAHLTIRPTFAAEPRRVKVLLAKAGVVIATSAALMVITVAVSYVAAKSIFGSRDLKLSLDDVSDGSAPLVGACLLGVGLGLLGMALGMLIRSQPGAIAILIVWPLLAENLLAGLLSLAFGDGAIKWLPYVAGYRMAFVGEQEDFLDRVPSGLYFFAVISALWLLGASITSRRDA